jgi:hypothetical protein
MSQISLARLLAIPLCLLGIVGCGGGLASVSGEVTYNGEPAGNGYVTFSPADGKGATAGGPIEAGHYTVDNFTPGPKVVKIEVVKAVPFARNSADMAKRAAADKFFGKGTGLIDPADEIPPNAEGNNQKVDIQPGKQIRDFHLKRAGANKAP